ncbi:Holliday junction branch migration protein RuvA [Methylosarcina fibrata]|uniref:Holliday junction branch migration protein RuvA n=1 Tax=Methylosarcina fibrata TaxID=105972 RepID=UPI00038240EF|nr:Holliday junction branch migration protein RuvA [Methylosarcina fibrata]
MIGFLQGILVHKAPPLLLLDVRGVGYELEAPMTTFYNLPPIGSSIKLHTHLVIREDAHILFGFSTEQDRALFRMLIKVNGVGPKLALTILSGLSAEEFHRCIGDNDTQSLVRLPGVGKKTAERLLIEMRDRLPNWAEGLASGDGLSAARQSAPDSPKQEAISALCALGYKPQDAAKMVQHIGTDGKSCEDIIRLALQSTGR